MVVVGLVMPAKQLLGEVSHPRMRNGVVRKIIVEAIRNGR